MNICVCDRLDKLVNILVDLYVLLCGLDLYYEFTLVLLMLVFGVVLLIKTI